MAAPIAWTVGSSEVSAQFLHMPNGSRRMAVTDYDTDTGIQPRVWLVTYDNYLASKAADQTVDAWALKSCCVESGVDAVSHTDGSTQRQRVFFARDNVIKQFVYDNDVYGGLSSLPSPPSGTEFRFTDVAAVTWNDGGTQRVAVASIATNGRVCVWEGTFSSFPYSPSCSPTSWAHTSWEEIHGTVVNGTAWFGYRLANGHMGRTRRSTAAVYYS